MKTYLKLRIVRTITEEALVAVDSPEDAEMITSGKFKTTRFDCEEPDDTAIYLHSDEDENLEDVIGTVAFRDVRRVSSEETIEPA